MFITQKKYYLLFIIFILLLSCTKSYADFNYAYINNKQNQKLICYDKKTNNVININLKKILKLDSDTFLEEVNNNNNESDFALRAYFIMKSNENTGIFLIDKNNLNDYYRINALLGEKYTNRAIALRKYILFPFKKYFTGTKDHKKENIQLIDLVTQKTISLGDFKNSFFVFKSLPQNTSDLIKKCLKGQEYALYTEINNPIIIKNKLFFTLNYYLERDTCLNSSDLTPAYIRLLSLDFNSKKISIEKENFYEILAYQNISNDNYLLFTKDKIIKYSFLSNKAVEFDHTLKMMSENKDADRPLLIKPLGFKNNIFYFLANDYFVSPEKNKIYSYDLNKIKLLFEFSYNEIFYLCGMAGNNFYTISKINDKDYMPFKLFNQAGKIITSKVFSQTPL